MRMVFQRMQCDGCGRLTEPAWTYAYVFDYLTKEGWALAVERKTELPDGGFSVERVDLCPECAKKEVT